MSKAGVAKATKAVSAAKTGVKSKVRKVYNSVHFRAPATKRPVVTPRKRVALHQNGRFDEHSILQLPLQTEAALKQIENNTLVFLCDKEATKPQIKAAVQHRFGVKVERVNTLIRPDCKKKAFIKLAASCDASEVASKLHLL